MTLFDVKCLTNPLDLEAPFGYSCRKDDIEMQTRTKKGAVKEGFWSQEDRLLPDLCQNVSLLDGLLAITSQRVPIPQITDSIAC